MVVSSTCVPMVSGLPTLPPATAPPAAPAATNGTQACKLRAAIAMVLASKKVLNFMCKTSADKGCSILVIGPRIATLKFGQIYMKLKLLSVLSVGVLGGLFLSGCSTVLSGSKTIFRNRENDYAHHAVSQPKPIKTPAGLPAVKSTPKYELPNGKDYFAPEGKALDLAPPGLNKTVPVPGEKHAASTSDHEAVQAKLDKIKAQIARLKAEEAAKKSGHAIEAPLTGKLLSSTIAFTKKQEGLLTVDAPFATTWNALPTAIGAIGYSVASSNKAKGIIHLQSKANAKMKLIIYVMPKVDLTQISLFDSHGKLLSSNLGYSLLQQIKANLHE